MDLAKLSTSVSGKRVNRLNSSGACSLGTAKSRRWNSSGREGSSCMPRASNGKGWSARQPAPEDAPADSSAPEAMPMPTDMAVHSWSLPACTATPCCFRSRARAQPCNSGPVRPATVCWESGAQPAARSQGSAAASGPSSRKKSNTDILPTISMSSTATSRGSLPSKALSKLICKQKAWCSRSSADWPSALGLLQLLTRQTGVCP
mmetsp:Transcript_68921/g.183322  ORF Transcript_68921/g.183322 Transcript_68921/m.183322 type:complete len:205 (+) Transcript_68921:179-793(+)